MKINDPFWNTWCEVTMVGSEVLMISVLILRNLTKIYTTVANSLKISNKNCVFLLITLIIMRFNV